MAPGAGDPQRSTFRDVVAFADTPFLAKKSPAALCDAVRPNR
jgi:hypothetical protein